MADSIETRGRPKGPPRIDTHCFIDQDLFLYFQVKLTDSFTGKMRKKGGLSDLVNRLLREEFNRDMQAKKENQP